MLIPKSYTTCEYPECEGKDSPISYCWTCVICQAECCNEYHSRIVGGADLHAVCWKCESTGADFLRMISKEKAQMEACIKRAKIRTDKKVSKMIEDWKTEMETNNE